MPLIGLIAAPEGQDGTHAYLPKCQRKPLRCVQVITHVLQQNRCKSGARGGGPFLFLLSPIRAREARAPRPRRSG